MALTKKQKAGVGVIAGASLLGLAAYLARGKLPGTASCFGVVIDTDTGFPVGGVTANLNGYSTLTNTIGYFLLSKVESGTYILNLSKTGYGGVTMSVTLAPGEEKDLGVLGLAPVVAPTCSIFGTVVDGDTDAPINGVLVTIGAWNSYTNANGDFAISEIEAGTYSVTFVKDGYEPLTI